MEEPLCRVEINRKPGSPEFVARVYSDYDGVREFRHTDLETLLRELTIDLEYSFGDPGRRGGDAPTPFEEEGVYPGEDML